MQGVTIAGSKHNVVFVGTYGDSFFAFDADSNGGTNGSALWKVSFLTNGTLPSGTYTTEFGVQGTPVIDASTNTIYLVSSEELSGTSEQTETPIFRLSRA